MWCHILNFISLRREVSERIASSVTFYLDERVSDISLAVCRGLLLVQLTV